MKSGDTYRFSLSWPMETEEQILAGEFIEKLGNRKSKFIIQLVCEYLNAHPEVMNPKETIQFIINSTSLGERLTDMVRSIIKSELGGNIAIIEPTVNNSDNEQPSSFNADENIDAMLDNIDVWLKN